MKSIFPTMSDQELINSLKKGSIPAFDEIFNRYWKRLYTYACKVSDDEVLSEDIVQEIFIHLWKRSGELSVINLEGYLFKAVRYKLANLIRNMKFTRQHDEALSELSELHIANTQMEYDEFEKEVFSVVDKLPERCRQVFWLSRFDGLSNTEIAEKLNISVRTVETHISNALKYLKINLDVALYLICLLILL